MSERAWQARLVDDLKKMADPDNPDRAALAHLRRGLDGSPDYTLGRVGWLFRGVSDSCLEDAILAAGLFAWVKGDCPHTPGVNFGQAFGARLSHEDKLQREKRFIDLLDTDRQELRYKLRQAITLIARDSIGLDWALLTKHLWFWDRNEKRRVQKEWARGFWAMPAAEEPAADQPIVTQ